jgi:hypothetical protein
VVEYGIQKNVSSRLLLQQLIGKDRVKDTEIDTLEFVATFHGVEVDCGMYS